MQSSCSHNPILFVKREREKRNPLRRCLEVIKKLSLQSDRSTHLISELTPIVEYVETTECFYLCKSCIEKASNSEVLRWTFKLNSVWFLSSIEKSQEYAFLLAILLVFLLVSLVCYARASSTQWAITAVWYPFTSDAAQSAKVPVYYGQCTAIRAALAAGRHSECISPRQLWPASWPHCWAVLFAFLLCSSAFRLLKHWLV